MWRGFRFDPFLNDGKGRRVFGMQFAASKDPAVRYDNIRLAMEMLAAHPSTAEHVCRKLAEHYVGVPASDALVRALAQAYLENGGDMRAVMRAMVAHKDFWSAPMKMATPFDFGMRVARVCRSAAVQLGADPNAAPNADQIEGFLKKSGMGLFDRVTPDGYPENNGNYADSNALLQRWRFMQTLSEHLGRLVPDNWRTPPGDGHARRQRDRCRPPRRSAGRPRSVATLHRPRRRAPDGPSARQRLQPSRARSARPRQRRPDARDDPFHRPAAGNEPALT